MEPFLHLVSHRFGWDVKQAGGLIYAHMHECLLPLELNLPLLHQRQEELVRFATIYLIKLHS